MMIYLPYALVWPVLIRISDVDYPSEDFVASGIEIDMHLKVGMTHFYCLALKTLLLGLST